MDKKLKKKIENVIGDIMICDGPDGHSDGNDIIADYVEAIINGKRDEWETKYFDNTPRKFARTRERFLSE